MSVRDISCDELRAVYHYCLGDRQLLEFYANVKEQELVLAMLAIHAANRTAISRNYNDVTVIKPFDIDNAAREEKITSDNELFSRLGNLLYNCVTNDGYDWLPEKHRQVINRLRLGLAYKHFEEGKA